jgi:hypothetical protein
MLKNHNPECVDLIDSLMAIPGTEELIQQIEGFKFKQALASLSELKKVTGPPFAGPQSGSSPLDTNDGQNK